MNLRSSDHGTPKSSDVEPVDEKTHLFWIGEGLDHLVMAIVVDELEVAMVLQNLQLLTDFSLDVIVVWVHFLQNILCIVYL